MNQLKIALIIFEVMLYVSAVTHWAITNDGKIQSNLNSIFVIKHPYDLPSFLEQDKRKADAEILYERIVARKASIDEQWAQIDLLTNVDSLFYTTDPNCQIIDKDKTNINLYASIATDGSFRPGITSKDFLLTNDLKADELGLTPECEETFPLKFSMYTFEHLHAMRNRQNLIQQEEHDLVQYLSPGMSIEKFASYIAYGLLKNKTSWLHLNLGAIYWRYKGNSFKALECARRAIVTAPRHYRDIPLLTTGGILHAARHSAEAAIILHTAINYAPDQSRQHLALGNIYATLGDYKRSIVCYENCLKLSPNMVQAKLAKHAILCHQKIEETLMTLHSQLQRILIDLQAYDKEQEKWLKLTERIYWNRNPQHLYLRFQDEWNLLHGPTHTCTQVNEDIPVLSCDVAPKSHMLPPNLQIDINVNLQMLKNIEKQARKINQQITKSTFLHGLNDESQKTKIKNKKPKPFELFLTSDEKLNKDKLSLNEDFKSDNWPTMLNCKNYEPFLIDIEEYVPVFLSINHQLQIFSTSASENKEKVSLWKPTCEMANNSHNYFTSMLFKLLKMSSDIYAPDSVLMTDLTALVKNNDIDEISRRLATAMKSKTTELWVVYSISSLYWRVIGKFYEALNCAQSALDSAPSDLKYIPLVNIASLLQKFRLFDEALAVVKQALNLAPKEPTANFLYGSLLHSVGNNQDALHYLKQAIKYNLHSMNNRSILSLKTIACKLKFNHIHDIT